MDFEDVEEISERHKSGDRAITKIVSGPLRETLDLAKSSDGHHTVV